MAFKFKKKKLSVLHLMFLKQKLVLCEWPLSKFHLLLYKTSIYSYQIWILDFIVHVDIVNSTI